MAEVNMSGDEKTYLTTVNKVDWYNPKISRVGIVPYFIDNDNIWY